MTAVAMTVLPEPVMADSAKDDGILLLAHSRAATTEPLEHLDGGVALVVDQLVAHQARPRLIANIDR